MEKSCSLVCVTCIVLLVQFYSLMVCFAVSSSRTSTNITADQYALLALKSHITSKDDILAKNWSTSTSPCNWIGVRCSTRHHRVASLNLSYMGIRGTLPPQIGNLSFLRALDITNNSFYGDIPKEIGHLRRLQSISFRYNNLTGSIPQEIGKLSNLKFLSMASNWLSGSIPASIFNISSLEIISLINNSLSGNLPANMCYHLRKLYRLNLSLNQFDGQIPSTLYECSELQFLSLSINNFSGTIPREIGNLTILKELYLGRNNLRGTVPQQLGNLLNLEILTIGNSGLTGAIPREIGNLTILKILDLGKNNLKGLMPLEIGNLYYLEMLVLQMNSLKGPIPITFFNMSNLRVLGLSNNYHISGMLPSKIRLPNLEELYLSGNYLHGIIPHSISNLSRLVILDLSFNRFSHSLPNSLGNLELLEILDLSQNNLRSESSNSELSIITSLTNCKHLRYLWLHNNPLNGILPVSIGNLSTSLQNIWASDCEIKGNIPNHIGNLSNLAFLRLYRDGLSGSIPTTMKGLKKLQVLHLGFNRIQRAIPNDLCQLHNLGSLNLYGNELSGPIPTCLGNVTSLRELLLGFNKLTSTIPRNLFSLKDILYLDLSSNSLSGYVPSEIGSMKAAIQIDLVRNRISGDIPSTIGGLQSLINLTLAHNRFQGHIPESIGNLLSLEFLDLSNNNLSGVIPKSMVSLLYLRYFNASFNRLRGEIPIGGPFANFTGQSFMSNEALCGASQFQVPPCHSRNLRGSRTKRVPLIVYIVLPIALIALTFAVLSIRYRKRNTTPTQMLSLSISPRGRISFQEILRSTDGFNDSNLLGTGGFGSVYRGTFTNGTIMAVKVFKLQLEGAFKSFDSECEFLRNIRHKNLTKVISSCSNQDFKALVLQYMPNGSLEKWLYSHNYFLDMLQRLDIMIDVACALDYLHHGYSVPIVHCDLKPSNVLLDEDMVAHLSDFGIAKFLGEGESFAHTETLATLGYIAPEYGVEGLLSTRSDVYSYGVMLMEVFTRTTPTDDMFAGGLSLKRWISESLPDEIIRVVDANLVRPEDGQLSGKVQCVSSIMQLAFRCCAESPQERIRIHEALATLKKIRCEFLTNRQRQET